MSNPQKQATQYENDVAAELWRKTEDIVVVRAGYSGNSVMPLPDVYLRTPAERLDAGVEMKKASSKGREEIPIEREDVEQLCKFAERNPEGIEILFALKFSSREPFIFPIHYREDDPFDFLEEITLSNEEHISYRTPNEDKYVVEKPDLESWSSAQAGDDMADVILSKL